MPKANVSNVIIVSRKYLYALKTAIRLVEYEKELGTKLVYSIIAYTSLKCENYYEASKAFVKLEHMEGLSETDRQKYEHLALQIFSKHSVEPQQQKLKKCPGKECNADVSELYIIKQ